MFDSRSVSITSRSTQFNASQWITITELWKKRSAKWTWAWVTVEVVKVFVPMKFQTTLIVLIRKCGGERKSFHEQLSCLKCLHRKILSMKFPKSIQTFSFQLHWGACEFVLFRSWQANTVGKFSHQFSHSTSTSSQSSFASSQQSLSLRASAFSWWLFSMKD